MSFIIINYYIRFFKLFAEINSFVDLVRWKSIIYSLVGTFVRNAIMINNRYNINIYIYSQYDDKIIKDI